MCSYCGLQTIKKRKYSTVKSVFTFSEHLALEFPGEAVILLSWGRDFYDEARTSAGCAVFSFGGVQPRFSY